MRALRNGRAGAVLVAGMVGLTGCAGPSADRSVPPGPWPQTVRAAGELLWRFPADRDPASADLIERGLRVRVAPQGVFVLDALGAAVLALTPDGELRARLGARGEGPGELVSPTDLAVGPDGRLFVADPATSRVGVFDASRGPIEDLLAAYPPVNIALTGPGHVLVPTLSAQTLLARVTTDGTADLTVDPREVPIEISSGPSDRMSLHGLLMADLGDGTLALLQNRHGADFRMWRVAISPDGREIVGVSPLPLPGWLYTMLEEETERVRATVPEDFAQGDFLVPFKAVHVNDGRLWLVPAPSSRVVAVTVDGLTDTPTEAVVAPPPVSRGLVDAAVAGNRLYALYQTELRVYRLDGYDGAFPMR